MERELSNVCVLCGCTPVVADCTVEARWAVCIKCVVGVAANGFYPRSRLREHVIITPEQAVDPVLTIEDKLKGARNARVPNRPTKTSG